MLTKSSPKFLKAKLYISKNFQVTTLKMLPISIIFNLNLQYWTIFKSLVIIELLGTAM